MIELKKINHGYLSFSGLSVWNDCPRKFKLKYIDKIRISSDNIYNHFGKTIHTILSEYFDNNTTKEEFIELSLKLWEELYFKNWKDEFIDTKFHLTPDDKIKFFEQGNHIIKNKLYGLIKLLNRAFGEFKIIGKEEEIVVDNIINATNTKGILDLIIETKKGKYIIDYKIVKNLSKWKKPTLDQLHQLNVYKKLYWIKHQDYAKSYFLIVPRENKPKEKPTLIKNTCDDNVTQEWIDDIAFGIQHEIFYKNNDKSKCFLCEYNRTEHCKK